VSSIQFAFYGKSYSNSDLVMTVNPSKIQSQSIKLTLRIETHLHGNCRTTSFPKKNDLSYLRVLSHICTRLEKLIEGLAELVEVQDWYNSHNRVYKTHLVRLGKIKQWNPQSCETKILMHAIKNFYNYCTSF